MHTRILAAVVFALAACGTTDPSAEGLRFSTDGSHFEAGGAITVALANQSDKAVGFNFCQRFWERKVGLAWERFEDLSICTPAFENLPAGDTAQATLGVPYGLVPGTYRVSAALLLGADPEPILSNEFVIVLGAER